MFALLIKGAHFATAIFEGGEQSPLKNSKFLIPATQFVPCLGLDDTQCRIQRPTHHHPMRARPPSTDAAPGDTLLRELEVLTPGFHAARVDLGGGRRLIALDSRPDDDAAKPPAVFLHGFPDNATSAHPAAARLVAGGRRCVLLSCPGYDDWRGPLDPASVAAAYRTALDVVLGRGAGCHLVGHDWGAVHASFLARSAAGGGNQNERILSLTMAAVPHNSLAGFSAHPYSQMNRSWYMAFFQLPWLPERWLRRGGLEYLWRTWSPGYALRGPDGAETPYFAGVRRTLLAADRRGALRGAVRMYRDTIGASFLLQWLLLQGVFLLRPLLGLDNAAWSLPAVAAHSKLATQQQREEAAAFYTMPVLGITGADDGCIGTRLFDLTMATTDGDATYRAGCALLRVENAGHFVFAEAPGPVAEALASHFIRAAERAAGRDWVMGS